MQNIDLEKELKVISTSNKNQKIINQKIIDETAKLQNDLADEKENAILAKNKIREIINNTDEHIVKRFWAWINYGKKEISYHPIDGIMADLVFQEIVVLDKWSNVVEEVQAYFLSRSNCFGEDFTIWNIKFQNSFENIRDENEKEELREILEDAIEKNLLKFLFDC